MGGHAARCIESTREVKSLALLMSLFLVACETALPIADTVSRSSNKSYRAQLENHAWQINHIEIYDEMLPEDYLTVAFNSGEMAFENTCGGFWGKYHFESDEVVWLEMWDVSQNACTDLVKLPDGSSQERISSANKIQAALKRLTGRYLITQSDDYNLELRHPHKNNEPYELGFSRGLLLNDHE